MKDNFFKKTSCRAPVNLYIRRNARPKNLGVESGARSGFNGGANLPAFLSSQLSINAPTGNSGVNSSAQTAPAFAARGFFVLG